MTARHAKDAFSVRRATAADADTIHRLIVELATDTGLRHKVSCTPADFREYGFGDDAAFTALLAERGGAVVGMALFFLTFSSWRGEPGVYLQDLVVAASARGQGLGRRLLAETARAGLEAGATHLRLSVEARNSGAIRFYESCGLVECGGERIFMLDGSKLRALGAGQ